MARRSLRLASACALVSAALFATASAEEVRLLQPGASGPAAWASAADSSRGGRPVAPLYGGAAPQEPRGPRQYYGGGAPAQRQSAPSYPQESTRGAGQYFGPAAAPQGASPDGGYYIGGPAVPQKQGPYVTAFRGPPDTGVLPQYAPQYAPAPPAPEYHPSGVQRRGALPAAGEAFEPYGAYGPPPYGYQPPYQYPAVPQAGPTEQTYGPTAPSPAYTGGSAAPQNIAGALPADHAMPKPASQSAPPQPAVDMDAIIHFVASRGNADAAVAAPEGAAAADAFQPEQQQFDINAMIANPSAPSMPSGTADSPESQESGDADSAFDEALEGEDREGVMGPTPPRYTLSPSGLLWSSSGSTFLDETFDLDAVLADIVEEAEEHEREAIRQAGPTDDADTNPDDPVDPKDEAELDVGDELAALDEDERVDAENSETDTDEDIAQDEESQPGEPTEMDTGEEATEGLSDNSKVEATQEDGELPQDDEDTVGGDER